jgi:hypothetical protein
MVSECPRLWHRTLIALCVRPGGPARLIVIALLLREQEQNLNETSLLLEDGRDFVVEDLHDLVFPFQFHFSVKNTSKHRSVPFVVGFQTCSPAGALGGTRLTALPEDTGASGRAGR